MRPHSAGHFAADVADVSHHMHVGYGVVDGSIDVGQQGMVYLYIFMFKFEK